MKIIDANNKNFIYYVTEPCYNENSKPSDPIFIIIIFVCNILRANNAFLK